MRGAGAVVAAEGASLSGMGAIMRTPGMPGASNTALESPGAWTSVRIGAGAAIGAGAGIGAGLSD